VTPGVRQPGHTEAIYRPDIDGLRAVAVLSVVLYHLYEPLAPGGFVGVDIFFVISGFLITRNVWNDIATRTFSFADFYLRRIRRIAPAYLALVAATLAAGALLLLPDDLARLGRSAAWSTVSLSNVYFWKHLDTGYFAAATAEEPLLHLWSLGVEEQFYFVWPAMLVGAALLTRRRAGALVLATVACVLSFYNAQTTLASDPKWAYYMLPPRGGELMIGAWLAIATFRGHRMPMWAPPRAMGEVLALAGFGLIGYALFGLDSSSPFPGINALYPCLGTALLILAGAAGSRIVRLTLTPRPVVYIGLISYSLYLWHWPVLAYLRYFFGEIDVPRGAFAVVAMAVTSVLSYRFIETPARRWRAPRAMQAAALYFVPSALVAGAAFAVMSTHGFKERIERSPAYRSNLARVEKVTAPAYRFAYNCQLETLRPGILRDPRCIVPVGAAASKQPGLLLWGDSHAAHYIGVIGEVARANGFAFRNVSHSSCPPVFEGTGYGGGVYEAGCNRFRPYMRAAILSGAYRTVVIGGVWNVYERTPSFHADFERTIREISDAGVRVVLLGSVPRFDAYNRACDLRGLRVGGIDCRARYTRTDDGDPPANRWLQGLARAHHVDYLDVREVLCSGGSCSPYLDGEPVYFDGGHLSMDGSWRVGSHLLALPAGARWRSVLSPERAKPIADANGRLERAIGTSAIAFAPRHATLLGGYVPTFAHHVRSAKNAGSLQGPSGIVMETWGESRDAIAMSIRRDLGAKGFREVSIGPSGDAVRMAFRKDGMPQVLVNVGPLGALVPQAPGADGIVYIHW
jgi:peptidoglycan/LPS O-acetylase OafA/YrhL